MYYERQIINIVFTRSVYLNLRQFVFNIINENVYIPKVNIWVI